MTWEPCVETAQNFAPRQCTVRGARCRRGYGQCCRCRAQGGPCIRHGGEFPELQGIAGRHYALNDGLSDAVADAIEQHYWPKFSGDQLPSSPESAAVALADRLDTLVGIFGIGQSPTGSKDPFALRRASVAIIRLLLAFAPHADIKAVISDAVAGFESGTLASETVDTVFGYLLERLPAHYEDLGVSVEILRAVTQ